MLIWIAVFFAVLITDICWTLYLFSVHERKSLMASMWATFIYLFGAFAVTSYVQNKYLIIAAAIGSFVGTYITIEYKKRKERKK